MSPNKGGIGHVQGAEGRAGRGEGAGSCEGPPSLALCPTEDLGPKEHVSGVSAQEAAEGGPGSTRCVLAQRHRGLALPQLLYSKFTEYLEDYHVWASAHSRPSGRGPLHTPRLSVTFALLCAHACAAALAVAAGHEQVGPFLTAALASRPCCVSPSGRRDWETGARREVAVGKGPCVLQTSGDMGYGMASAHCHHRAWLSRGSAPWSLKGECA